MSPRSIRTWALLAGLVGVHCSGDAGGEGSESAEETGEPKGEIPYAQLSDYGFFVGDLVELEPAAGVVPYSVVSPLWADHAEKGRFIVLPEGETIAFSEREGWSFPLGSIIIKTFYFDLDRGDPGGDARIMETRLLILEDEGWTAHTYVWNEEQTEATYRIAGANIDVEFVDESGMPTMQSYRVPSQEQCDSCHGREDGTHLLGLVTPQLNFVREIEGEQRNQLEWLADQGLFNADLPDLASLSAFAAPFGDESIDERVRAYLHANCSHCHRPEAGAAASGINLLAWNDNPLTYGICKTPAATGGGAGGRPYDITPGDPDQSIVIYRMNSTDVDVRMPEIGSRVIDVAGVELVREWIAGLTPVGCGQMP